MGRDLHGYNMTHLSPNGYFYSKNENAIKDAAYAVSTSFVNSLDDGAYKETTHRWSDVRLASDGSGVYYTEKHPNDDFNETARGLSGVLEGEGDELWFPIKE